MGGGIVGGGDPVPAFGYHLIAHGHQRAEWPAMTAMHALAGQFYGLAQEAGVSFYGS